MKIKRTRAILIIIILGFAMTCFSSVLTTMSYRKMQADTFVHTQTLNLVSAVRRLNYALSFGKPLDKYYGLEELLEGILVLSEDIQGVEVADSEGNRIETAGDIPEEIRQSSVGEEYVIKKDGIYTFTAFDAGTIILRLDISVIDALTKTYIGFLLRLSLMILLILVIVTVIACSIGADEGIGVTRMRITGILTLIVAQLALGGISLTRVDSSYRDSVERIAAAAAQMIENDINAVIEKGVTYEELTGIDEYLKDLEGDIPEVSDLSIQETLSSETDNEKSFALSIEGTDTEKVRLSCHYQYDQDLIRKNRINNIVDVLILVMITIFISLEAISFSTKHMEQKNDRKKGELYLPGFRLFVFVEGIAFALDAGFFSVYSTKLYSAMDLPDSLSFLSGMPNTMYSAAVLIGLFGCSSLMRRFGMKQMMTAGILAGSIGYILCALSPNLPVLIIARFVYGFCDGIIINAIRLYASAQKDPQAHTRILVEYYAAINLGVSCGVVIGGLVADVASYQVVFLTGAVLGAACLFLIVFAGFSGERAEGEKMSFFDAVKDLRKPQILVFMISVVIPVYIMQLFVSYTFPIFGDEVGFSNSIVSGCLMLNFIIIAYLTDPIADWVGKRLKPQYAMVLYLLLQTFSVGIFVVTSKIWAAILALILTSLWDCFGSVLMDSALDHVEGTTTEKCTLLQMVFGKLSMVIGPVAVTSFLYKGAAAATGVIVVFLAVGLIIYSVSLMLEKRRGTGIA